MSNHSHILVTAFLANLHTAVCTRLSVALSNAILFSMISGEWPEVIPQLIQQATTPQASVVTFYILTSYNF